MLGEVGVGTDQLGGDLTSRHDLVLVLEHGQEPETGAATGLRGAEHVALPTLLEVHP